MKKRFIFLGSTGLIIIIFSDYNMESKNNLFFHSYRELSEVAANHHSSVIYNWQAHIIHMSWHKNATKEQNKQHTAQAIKKAESLFNFTSQASPRDKEHIAQKIKDDFYCTIFKQPQENWESIGIENIKLFDDALNKIIHEHTISS